MKMCHFLVNILLLLFNINFWTYTSGHNLEPEACLTKDVMSVAVRKATPYNVSGAGHIEAATGAVNLESCLIACCENVECSAFLFFREQCYLIECSSEISCSPVPRKEKNFENTYMAVIRRASEEVKTTFSPQITTTSPHITTTSLHISTTPPFKYTWCIVGLDIECYENEHCVAKNKRARQGHCECNVGFKRHMPSGKCILNEESFVTTESPQIGLDVLAHQEKSQENEESSNTSTVRPFHRIVVSAGDDKVIRLPDNSVTLSAFALPKENEETYKYEWTLLKQPEGDDNSGTMIDKYSPNLKLTELKAGVYMFKVSVTSSSLKDSGEAFVNVTVLPVQRNNKPPVAIIQPDHQVVKVPNTDIILDGSRSTDDDKIARYHWEEVMAPIGNQLEIKDTSILELKNLIPGFYRFKLTVTDSDGATNSTFANVTVDKETDYPPKAIAGADVMVQLPASEVILNGNLSTDDKGIKSWEWTRNPSSNLAVDMQGTSTPYLRLSNFQPGDYTFILKVTDTADQSAVDEVQVIVKEENNHPPVADAGPNQEITLQDILTLDGSKSRDDTGIIKYEWMQISGPYNAFIKKPSSAKTDVVIRHIGEYQFQLTVYDSKSSFSSAVVNITVKQGENKPPKASAGGDKEIQLPNNLIIINGSQSSDDVEIVSYQWTRDPNSLAAGEILGNSDKSPVLELTNISPGRYIFHLKVMDSQGATSEDSASIIVKPAIYEKDLVELYLNADISSLTEQHKVSLVNHLGLLLHSEADQQIVIEETTADKTTRRVVVTFYVKKLSEKNKEITLSGPEVVIKLKKKLKTDAGILDFSVLSVDTMICQNNCSGHGRCEQSSRQCLCEAFWMQDLFRLYFGDQEGNCDWSILYVIIIVFLLVIAFAGLLWGIICLGKKFHFQPRRRHRYTLLDDYNNKESFAILQRGDKANNSIVVSESDTFSDEETIFDKRKKTNSFKLGVPAHPNGIVKTAHRTKT